MINRKSKSYNINCPTCKTERFVTYAQSRNVINGVSTGKCKKCANHNISGFKLGHGWNKGLQGYLAGHPAYNMKFGEDNPSWKGGVTPINMKIRNSIEYAQWRILIFQRDNYTCVECGQFGGKLNADHIKPFSLFPELRLDPKNGRTLCFECHKQTDSYLSKIYSYGRNI